MRVLLVLYGSQTGTAEEVAERIGREADKYYFKTAVCSMNECSLNQLGKEKIVVFVASTTGQGDDPDNMREFFQSIWKNRTDRNLLRSLHYAVLGLGDSSYQKFNFAAKRLNKLLNIVGAKPLVNIGLADDQHELGADFVIDSWLKDLWVVLLNMCPLPEGIEPKTDHHLPLPKFQVNFVTNQTSLKDGSFYSNFSHDSSSSESCLSIVTSNLRKTSAGHFQDVRLIEFDISNSNINYMPGDVVMIQPQNLTECVDEFLNILGLDGSKMYSISPRNNAKLPNLLPQPCTIRQCVTSYFDIQSIPRRYFFELLSFFTTNENEKEKFLEFSSSEGQESYYDYCHRPRRSILEVLADFPDTKGNIPFEYLFDLIPPIRPRAYSIASSSQALPGKLQILMAVVEYKTILKQPRRGLCSNWLARLDSGSHVNLWVKPGTLIFPDARENCHPVVMIGPGTGCAPFRSYIQERVASGSSKNIVMIFGCRGKNKDYFFKDEWENLYANSELHLFCAFSRDQEEKIYVQHIMRENVSSLWNFIKNNETKLFYAGNAKRIPIDVYEALQYIVKKSLNLSNEEAEQYMKKNLEKRYQTETWA